MITKATMGSSFPTVTHWYACPYLTGDQIWERGKNLNAVTKGETFSDLWMDDLIYATAVHASHHLRTNRNLDGYVVTVVVLVFGVDPSCYRMLNKLLMRGLFDPEIPPEHSNCWMTRLTRYTATVGVRNDCPVYAFFFVFPFISLFNPHSFTMTSYVPIYSYFSSLAACLYVRYSAH